ncbi:unnamed protein product [Calypogeia fissa]
MLMTQGQAAPHGWGTHLCFNGPSRKAVIAAAPANGGSGDGGWRFITIIIRALCIIRKDIVWTVVGRRCCG